MVLKGSDLSVWDRLRQAEEAQAELQRLNTLSTSVPRLQSLAAEIPRLRAELTRLERARQREETRQKAVDEAQDALRAADNTQTQIPDLLDRAVQAVYDLYVVMKKVESQRQEALAALCRADRIDYEGELEDAQDEARSLGQDAGHLAYALAKQHGEERAREILAELSPDFTWFKGCNMNNTLHRELGHYVLRHAVPHSE